MSTQHLEVTIRELAGGGEGVADLPGDAGVVFVAATAPGDRVRVRVASAGGRRRWRRGQLEALLSPGPDRVAPACPVADRCGGCGWQHVSYGAQLAAKGRLLARALRGAGLHPEIQPPEAAPAPLGYRCRARLAWRPGAHPALGFRAARSHAPVDIHACPVLLQSMSALLAPLHRGLSSLPPLAVHLLGAASGKVALGIGPVEAPQGRSRSRPSGPRPRSAGGGRGAGPRALSLGTLEPLLGDPALDLAGITRVDAAGAEQAVLGTPLLDLAPPGALPVLSTPAGFAQANPLANERLRSVVAGWAAAGALGSVLELFAGSGNLTRTLVAAGAREVLAVESSSAAVSLGRTQGAPGVRWLCAEAAPAVMERARDKGRPTPDLVVLDPPRSGARALMGPLADLAPARILYVSCDAMTLARDARALVDRGYEMRRARVVDTMPQTAHFETVAELVRG